ncbi:MAG: aminopeptidase P family protein [Muribaculaceae bacterium]|nr:aminopeptidase P family protein [Muribaculaceae bacterium]
MSNNTLNNLSALREAMASARVDAVIVPGTDAHQSEYVCDHWKMRDWVSGFTGSNGTAVVTLNDARLWTDSRYFLQAEQQLEGSGFKMMKEDIPGEPTLTEWLAENLEEGAILAVDGTLFSLIKANALEEFCGFNGFRFATDFRPFDEIWSDRPARPNGELFIHDAQFAGEDVNNKIERVLQQVDAAGADSLFIVALDEIAWLFNIRCDDVAFTPVAIAFAYISNEKRVIFVDSSKVNNDVAKYFKDNEIKVLPYEDVTKFLAKLSNMETVLIDPNLVSDTLGRAIDCGKIYQKSPIGALKGVKNEVQIAGTREAMERDGAALVKMFMWLEQNVASGNVTEIDVWEKGKEMRALHPYYRGDSFKMIAGYKEHGAIVHYTADENSNATLSADGLLLVDSGAQYIDGTTDITRTISLGNPSHEEIHDYTLVLKGHIAIATQLFPVGTRGAQLDALARQFMWKEGVSYFHGTGHGVGHFLSVHEGPQNIRLNENPAELKPGMITSDEPGVYRTGKYGIRTENLTLVVPAVETEEFGDFYKFETLTLYPYDAALIDVSMLSDEELNWINAYHEMVKNRLAKHLNDVENEWLASKTKTILR